jgi:hypothetical protein
LHRRSHRRDVFGPGQHPSECDNALVIQRHSHHDRRFANVPISI